MAPSLTETATREIPGGLRISAHIDDGERVPAILLVPSHRPAPAALLIHGYTSHKERMAESVGMALLRRGVGSVSIDLPLHGEREGTLDREVLGNPFEVVSRWRLAVQEARSAIQLMVGHPAIDRDRIGLVGYSLGAFLGVAAAAAERQVRAVLLAAGGDLPANLPFGPIVRSVADPPRMVRKLAGRPLLMVNGRLDRTVRRDQAERLFAAASEPKEIRWYGGGHWPPPGEIEGACDWMADRLAGERQEYGVG
jgi:dienelactone hydrolase